MVKRIKFRDFYPFSYREKHYSKAGDFVNDSAFEIIHHARWTGQRPFTIDDWRKRLPESLRLAMERRLVKAVIGRVNFAFGHPCDAVFAVPVKRRGKRLVQDEVKVKSKRRGPRKYPEDKAALIEMLTILVANLRREDGSELKSVSDWRNAHAGSHRTAQVAGVHLDVAKKLGLEAQSRRSPKTAPDTKPKDARRRYPEDPEELRNYLVKLIGDMRLKDGSRITTLKQWAANHHGSHHAAERAGILHEVADDLGLKHKAYKARKPTPADTAIIELTATVDGRGKYPTDPSKLFKYMVELVSLLRFDDGTKVKSLGDWRKLHNRSYRKAQKERMLLAVARVLYLQHPGNNSDYLAGRSET